jgi:diacylglycerol kinase (ATP)
MKNSFKLRPNILYSLGFAIRGIAFSIYSQRNMLIHLIIGIIAIGLGLFFKISQVEWLCLILTITLVLISELINTSIEITVDLFTRKRKFRAMLSKDIAAGAVLISVINAAVVGYLLFFDRFVNLISGGN